MRRPEFIARQSGHPSGVLGRVIAWVMERETAAQNDAALTALAIRVDDRVLEIGFGHGRTLERLADAAPSGFIAGIDRSPDMYAMARRRCAPLLDSGRLQLRVGDSRALPYPDGHFDKVLAVHTLYFWDDPTVHLRELRRVLKTNGICVLGFRPKGNPNAANFPETVYTFHARDDVQRFLSSVGFADVELSEPVPGFVLASALRRS